MREVFKLKIVSPFGEYELPFYYTKNGVIVDTQEKNNLGIRIASEMYDGSYPESWVAGWENDPFKSLLPCFISADGTAYICKDGDENSMAKMILNKNFRDIVIENEAQAPAWVINEGFVFIQKNHEFKTKEYPTTAQKDTAELFNVSVNNETAGRVMAISKLKKALHS